MPLPLLPGFSGVTVLPGSARSLSRAGTPTVTGGSVSTTTGSARSLAWIALIVLYLLGVSFTKALFASVAFVAVISLYANAATDFGQVAASLAQLTAGDVHHDVAAARRETAIDVAAIEKDLERLARLQPCKEADELAASIRAQIAGHA